MTAAAADDTDRRTHHHRHTRRDVERLVEARQAQGLPARICDPDALEHVAAVLHTARHRRRNHDRRS